MDEQSSRRALGVPEPSFEIVRGRRLAYRRIGRGMPVVCLHAIGHGGSDYLPLAERISDRAELVIVDWPGHGHSDDDGEAPRVSTYAEIVRELVVRIGIERPILIGNSIGGAAAIEYAAREGSEARALVICNAGGLAPIDGTARFAIGTMERFFRAGERGRRWFALAYALYYRAVLPRAPAQRAKIVRAGYELAPLLRGAWEGFRTDDLRESARALKVPVLAAWAERDRVVPLARSRAALERIPDHRIETFEGGHAAFLEAPDAFAASFVRFVETLRDASTRAYASSAQ
jgi:pimeloyl-ACP methyl ester carboxylesterase